LVAATTHIRIGIEFIINCTICAECDLDVTILEKTCNFSYLWAAVCKGDPYLWFEGVLMCKAGKESCRIMKVLDFENAE